MSHHICQPRYEPARLQQVEEFCACFATARLWHELRFETTGDWAVARALVDAVHESEFVLDEVSFLAIGHIAHLEMRLTGSGSAQISRLWYALAAVRGSLLTRWESHASLSSGKRIKSEV